MGSSLSTAVHLTLYAAGGAIMVGAAYNIALRDAETVARQMRAATDTIISRFFPTPPTPDELDELRNLLIALHGEKRGPTGDGCPGLSLTYCLDILMRGPITGVLSDGTRVNAMVMCRQPQHHYITHKRLGILHVLVVVIDVVLSRTGFGKVQLEQVETYFRHPYYYHSGIKKVYPDISHILFELDATTDDAIRVYKAQGYSKTKIGFGHNPAYTGMAKLLTL